MATIILPDRWRRQPSGPLQLNYGHWAASRIVWAVGPWLNPWYDHRSGGNAGFTFTAGTASKIATPTGLAVNFNSSTYYSSTVNPLMHPLAWLTVGIGQTGTTNYAIGGAGDLSSSKTRWQLDNYSGNIRSVLVNTAGTNPGLAIATAKTANNEPYVAFFRVDASKIASTFFKGEVVTAAANSGTVSGWTRYRIGVLPYGTIEWRAVRPAV